MLYDAPGPKTRRRSRIISAIVLLAVVAILAWVILTLAAQGVFDAERWDIFNDPLVWLALLDGLWVTLQVAFYGAILAISLGMVLSLLRSSDRRAVRIPTTIVLEFLRGMPVLLMILFILLLFSTGAFWAVVLALGLYNGAIIGEALRSGLESLPRGQRESGLAIGLEQPAVAAAHRVPAGVPHDAADHRRAARRAAEGHRPRLHRRQHRPDPPWPPAGRVLRRRSVRPLDLLRHGRHVPHRQPVDLGDRATARQAARAEARRRPS